MSTHQIIKNFKIIYGRSHPIHKKRESHSRQRRKEDATGDVMTF